MRYPDRSLLEQRVEEGLSRLSVRIAIASGKYYSWWLYNIAHVSLPNQDEVIRQVLQIDGEIEQALPRMNAELQAWFGRANVKFAYWPEGCFGIVATLGYEIPLLRHAGCKCKTPLATYRPRLMCKICGKEAM